MLPMTFQWETLGNKIQISTKSLHLFSLFLVHPLPNILFKSSVLSLIEKAELSLGVF